jgi:hypothetical protein
MPALTADPPVQVGSAHKNTHRRAQKLSASKAARIDVLAVEQIEFRRTRSSLIVLIKTRDYTGQEILRVQVGDHQDCLQGLHYRI